MNNQSPSPIVVVTGANGLVGSRICRTLAADGATVRAIVRTSGTAPEANGIQEFVGDFHDADLAAAAVEGATALITTVHPLGGDRATQHKVAVEGTPAIARAARDAGVGRMVHISTAAVYDRSPGTGDVNENSALVGDDDGAYPTTKRDTDQALTQVEGMTRVLLRPPAILGEGDSSVWNTKQPAAIKDDPEERKAPPEQTFAWVHVDDLARFAADIARGVIDDAADPDVGPVPGQTTVVNVAAASATIADYYGAVASAVGVDPVWTNEPAWTGSILADRARSWGWIPQVDLEAALQELREGLSD